MLARIDNLIDVKCHILAAAAVWLPKVKSMEERLIAESALFDCIFKSPGINVDICGFSALAKICLPSSLLPCCCRLV